MNWEALFAASAKKLQASLDEVRAAVEHRTLKGTANEEAVAEWLKPLLPGQIDVCTGEVIDSDGGRSKQVDVLLFDALTTPRFLSRGDISVLPIEPVYAAMEIKTYLNKGEIEKSFENMKALKALKKTAFHPNRSTTTTSLYGIPGIHWPIQFFIFAFEADSLDTVLAHVVRLNAAESLDKRIDLVCVLEKGLIVNSGPDGLQPIPMPNTTMIAKPSSKPLLTFYALIAHLLGQAMSEPFAMHPYLRHIKH